MSIFQDKIYFIGLTPKRFETSSEKYAKAERKLWKNFSRKFVFVQTIIFQFTRAERIATLETEVQFHQHSTGSFCANSLVPVKYKSKT